MEGENIKILPEGFNQFDLNFKVIIVGDSATKPKENNEANATVGFEFQTFTVKINNTVIKLQIWDTCGQEVYKSLVANFYRSSSLAILCYSIDNIESFKNINIWLKELKKNSLLGTKIILIGNKLDLENKREVLYEVAKKFKEENYIDYFTETSAKNENLSKEIFIEAAKILHNEYINNPISERTYSYKSSSIKQEESKKISCNSGIINNKERNVDSSSGKCSLQ